MLQAELGHLSSSFHANVGGRSASLWSTYALNLSLCFISMSLLKVYASLVSYMKACSSETGRVIGEMARVLSWRSSKQPVQAAQSLSWGSRASLSFLNQKTADCCVTFISWSFWNKMQQSIKINWRWQKALHHRTLRLAHSRAMGIPSVDGDGRGTPPGDSLGSQLAPGRRWHLAMLPFADMWLVSEMWDKSKKLWENWLLFADPKVES